jgi:hypothetical protein
MQTPYNHSRRGAQLSPSEPLPPNCGGVGGPCLQRRGGALHLRVAHAPRDGTRPAPPARPVGAAAVGVAADGSLHADGRREEGPEGVHHDLPMNRDSRQEGRGVNGPSVRYLGSWVEGGWGRGGPRESTPAQGLSGGIGADCPRGSLG